MDIPDSELVARAIDDDTAAYDVLVERHGQRLLAAALHLVGDAHRAQQLVREIFAWGYEALATCPNPHRFGSWLFSHLADQCRQHMKRGTVQSVDLTALPDLKADEGFTTEVREIYIPFLNSIHPQHREMLAAVYLVGMTHEEIAEWLKITIPQVRMRSYDAKAALLEIL